MRGRPKSTYNEKKKNWYCDDLTKLELFKKRFPDVSVSEFINRQLGYEIQTRFSNLIQKRAVILRRINVLSLAKEKAHEKVDIKFNTLLKPLIKEVEKINKQEAKKK